MINPLRHSAASLFAEGALLLAPLFAPILPGADAAWADAEHSGVAKSSESFSRVIMDDVKYLDKTDDGSNSTFIIPISALDEEIAVVADTTSMGDPAEIEYQLTFCSETIGDKDLIPQEAAIKVLELAVIVIVAGGIVNYILKKRRKQ